jgi:phage tail tape-measure protein
MGDVMAETVVTELVSVFCPKCGHGFTCESKSTGKKVGLVGGALAGAKVGAGVGLVGGPIGAIAGTIPGALLGAVFGGRLGRSVADDPKCPKCSTKFELPK